MLTVTAQNTANQQQSAETHRALGRACMRQSRFADAAEHFRQAARLLPGEPLSHFEWADSLLCCGQLDAAEVEFRETIRLDPSSAETLAKLAAIKAEQENFDQVEALARRAIELRPDLVEASFLRGVALTKLKNFEEAQRVLAEALRMAPDLAPIHNALGMLQSDRGHHAAAAASFRRALELEPRAADVLLNLAIAHRMQRKFDEAHSYFEQALAARPAYADAHWSRATLRLLQGDLVGGFAEGEWRLHTSGGKLRTPAWPLWGGAAGSRSLVLCAEQGLGDTLQFVRYAALAKAQFDQVLLECPESLHPLLSRTPGIDQLVATSARPPRADRSAPLLSMPHLLGTSLETIPANVPYLFADPTLVEQWRIRLDAGRSFTIGIVWQGNPQTTGDQLRSIPLAHFEPLARIEGVRLVSLQKGPGSEQLAALDRNWDVADLGALDATGAFMDTAAIMMNLDLVVTCDTSAAHLAGGLGAPVFVALPYVPDWRWLLDRLDSPWYPTMRLFRQPDIGDWPSVFAELASAIQDLQQTSRPQRP